MNISHDSGGNICVMGDATPNTLGKFLDAEGAIASLEEETSTFFWSN